MAPELNHSQQSQSSSIESPVSRASGRRPISKEDSSPRSHYHFLRETTPSTSLSNQSSQERAGSVSPVYPDGASESERMPADLCHDRQYPPEKSSPRAANMECDPSQKLQASKRTLSGQVKASGNHQWASSEGAGHPGHSRNSSTASKISQVSELSHDLHTRLSYAMFKVQNGWQSHNLNELEAMAIPKTPPSSTISQMQRIAASPTLPTTHPQHHAKKLQNMQGSPLGSRIAYEPPNPQEPLHSPRFQRNSPADEAFRQGHATQNVQKYSSPQGSPYRGPTLAPPADILPRNSRSFHASNAQLPSLKTSNLPHNAPVSTLSPSDPSIVSATPPRRPAPTIRTPSQKAAMEKDAVETLMFMSSPGNSGCHPAFHNTTSPMSNHTVNMSPKRATFASATDNRNLPASNASQPLNAAKLSTAAEIDRILDEMPDRYSSSDDEGLFA
ncbi:MAG: hypothetical protein Q9225_003551 [Loekoesia sp. 1 TL-2023]